MSFRLLYGIIIIETILDYLLMIIHNLKMSIMLKQFYRYVYVGMINTVIHWLVFSLCVYGLSTSQYLANLSGFLIAVSFSFYANARVTFKAEMTTLRYVFFCFYGGVECINWLGCR